MLHTATVQTNDFMTVLLPDAIEHQRIPPDAAVREANTINRYLAAAIQATQNYLDKDLWPTVHTYAGIDVWPFDWTRGNVRNVTSIVPAPAVAIASAGQVQPGLITPDLLAAADAREVREGRDPDRVEIVDNDVRPNPGAVIRSSDYVPPAGWEIDSTTLPILDGGVDLRAGRLRINWPTGLFTGQLVIESGFAAAADLPPDVVEFILAVFGTHYALRESSNYSSMVFNVDNYPKYLLDPYRTLSYA